MRYNLSSVYILSLLGYNRKSFGEDNFINSFITKDLKYLLVQIKDSETPINYKSSVYFVADYVEDSRITVIYNIESKKETVQLFLNGKYSKFPESDKAKIRQYSGLAYKITDDPYKPPFTDDMLLAMDTDPYVRTIIRKKIEDKVGESISEDAELYTSPDLEKELMPLVISFN